MSLDDGLTWQSTGQDEASAIAFTPTFAQDRTVFALPSYSSVGGILRSTDEGVSWQLVGVDTLPPYTQWIGLVISPNYAGDRTLVAWSSRQAYLSTDAGLTWAPFGPEAALRLNFVVFSPTYARDRRIWRSEEGPGDRFQVTNDRGRTWQVAGDGMPGASVLGVIGAEWTSATPAWAITANGLLTANGNNWSWRQAYPSYPRPRNDTALARSPAFAQDGAAIAFNAMTTDGGATWMPFGFAYALNEARRSVAAFAPDFPHSHTIAVVWAGYTSMSGDAAVSTDGGATWSERSLPLVAPSAIAFDANWPSQAAMYIGGEGGILRSLDRGQTWQDLGRPLRGLDVVGLVSRLETGRRTLCAATSTHGVWYSDDDGQTWATMNAGLPHGHACALAQVPELLAVSLCDGGVYIWQPGQSVWQRLGDRLPARITDLWLQRDPISITVWVAATNGVYSATQLTAELPHRALLPLIGKGR